MPDRQRLEVSPSIRVFDTVSLDVALCIGSIDGEIHRNPQLFQIALKLVDSKVIWRAIETGSHATGTTRLHPKPTDLLTEVFANGYDRLFAYDRATQSIIDSDPLHVELAGHRSDDESRPASATARNALSRLSFGIYIGLTAAYEFQSVDSRAAHEAIQAQLRTAQHSSGDNGQGAA